MGFTIGNILKLPLPRQHFTNRERQWLQIYRARLLRLHFAIDSPKNDTQDRLLQAGLGRSEPGSEFETIWRKFIVYVELKEEEERIREEEFRTWEEEERIREEEFRIRQEVKRKEQAVCLAKEKYNYLEQQYKKLNKPLFLYHLTSKHSLEKIRREGIYSRQVLKERGEPFIDVADQNVLRRRDLLKDFVPLWFARDTPMMHVVDRSLSVLIKVDMKAIAIEGTLTCSINAGVTGATPSNDISELKKIDWALLHRAVPNYKLPNRGKRNRSAEVLVPKHVPASCIKGYVNL